MIHHSSFTIHEAKISNHSPILYHHLRLSTFTSSTAQLFINYSTPTPNSPSSSKAPMCPAAPQTVTVTGSVALMAGSGRRPRLAAPAKQALSRLVEAPMATKFGWKFHGRPGNFREIPWKIAWNSLWMGNSTEILEIAGKINAHLISFDGVTPVLKWRKHGKNVEQLRSWYAVWGEHPKFRCWFQGFAIDVNLAEDLPARFTRDASNNWLKAIRS